MARLLVLGRVRGRTLTIGSTQAISLELKQAWARVSGDHPHLGGPDEIVEADAGISWGMAGAKVGMGGQCPRVLVPGSPWQDGWSYSGYRLGFPGVCHSRAGLVGLLELGEPHPGGCFGEMAGAIVG